MLGDIAPRFRAVGKYPAILFIWIKQRAGYSVNYSRQDN